MAGPLPCQPPGGLLAVLESSPDGVLLLDMAHRTVWCNGTFLQLWQLSGMDGLSAGEREALLLAHLSDESRAAFQSSRSGAGLFRLRDGRWLERRVHDHVVDGRKVGLVELWRDVSAVQQAGREARLQRELMDALMDSLPDPIYFKDVQSRYLRINLSMARHLGLSGPEQAVGRNDADFYSGEHAARIVAEEQEIMRTGQAVANRLQQDVWADGRSGWSLTTKMPLRDAHGVIVGTFGIAHDITEQKRNEALIWEQANFDALTGLPNRRMLRDRWEQASKHAQRNGLGLALLMMDLDHFKDVNDTLGHARGDELLIEVAGRLKSVVRDSDVVARLGGDEFCIVLTDLRESAHVGDIAQKIVTALGRSFQLGPDEVFVSASVGITLYPRDGTEIGALMQQADQALYDAKAHGRNGFRFFTAELQALALDRMRLGQDLRQALQQQQFFLVYQPIVHLASGRVGKIEALLRWQHPQRGVIGPRDFIPIAETAGLVTEIGEWVFRTAAQQLHDWRERISPQLQMAVNKSPLQGSKPGNTVQVWREQLQALGLLRNAIMVEITEGQLLEPSERIGQHLRALHDIGLSVSLDDFGTGLSSLASLQHFEIDFVKIDQSFVRNLGGDGKSLALCKAIISMGHELGMQVVAEGVENALQRDLLAAAGCDYAQGYFYSKPLPADQMEYWLLERR